MEKTLIRKAKDVLNNNCISCDKDNCIIASEKFKYKNYRGLSCNSFIKFLLKKYYKIQTWKNL